MVIFGGYHTATRFDDDEGSSVSPGPGAYTIKSSVEGAPAPRYARRIVEDGYLRPDGSPVLSTGRDSWIRGISGSKGLTTLSTNNPFISPITYSIDNSDRVLRATTSSARFTLEARFLSPSKRCLTSDHERAAMGCESPGPGSYYPVHVMRNFSPPEHWSQVDKAGRAPRKQINTKPTWSKPSLPVRPPYIARAGATSKEVKRAWRVKKRAVLSPTISPRCMWVTGVSTPNGLQAWGDISCEIGPINNGCELVRSPRSRAPSPRRGGSVRRGPVHTGETRATSPDFREVRFLGHDLTKQGSGTAKDTPGPGAYNVRPIMSSGTTFAGARPKCSRITTVLTAIACAECQVTGKVLSTTAVAERCWPHPPLRCSNRLQPPRRGADSPGPAYGLPSDFDLKRPNKQCFFPPRLVSKSRFSGAGRRGHIAAPVSMTDVSALSRARRDMQRYLAKGENGKRGSDDTLGVPVKTSIGQGILLQVRPNSVSLVQFPWGIFFTAEVLAHCSKSTIDP